MRFKVGDRLRPKEMDYSPWPSFLVLGVHEIQEEVRYWGEVTCNDGQVDTMTIFSGTVERWEKVPDFFEIGKTYILGESKTRYQVLDLYEVENPWHGSAATAAVTRFTRSNGKQGMTVLDRDDFRDAEEVK